MPIDIPHDQRARNSMLAKGLSRNVPRKKNSVPCKTLTEGATLPTKAHEYDAGWDLYASEDATVAAGSTALIKTGIAMAIPQGFVGLIWPRSGMAVKKGVDVFAGVIDSGYRGEVRVCLYNSSDVELEIEAGNRIAQILFQEMPRTTIVQVDELEDTDRGKGGFGSSGA
jgi:dUTP pyrophosphatase